MTEHELRLLFSLDLTITLLLFGQYIGAMFNAYGWGQRITVIGFFAFTTYVLAGQYKAVKLNFPFDIYSWGGVAAVTIINLGLGWSLWERRPRSGR